MNLNNKITFAVLSFSIVALILGNYNSAVQPGFITAFAQENQTGTENEAEVEADIEQENKCKKDTECENENELNNELSIINQNQEQTQSSLTVKKEIFGCDNIISEGGFTNMNCFDLDSNSNEWISCNDPPISNSQICQNIQENFFDIEVLDDQSTQLEQFQGSAQGTTIGNIEPGTYAVNEIVYPNPPQSDQLTENNFASEECTLRGFSAGGSLQTLNPPYFGYIICIQYEDEQGNDCSQTTVNENEAKVCTVKNYILSSSND